MSDWELSNENHQEVLRRDILPLYFPPAVSSDDPTLVLLIGQPGAGRSRSTGQLIAEHGADVAALNADDLGAFHPRFLELAASRSPEASAALSRATAGWVRDCVRFARENHRSLLLEGAFQDPSIALATAARFAAEGFATRIVVVASRRAESLMCVVSRYLREVHAGAPAQYTSLAAHDRGFTATRSLVPAIEESAAVDRLTVLGRGGRVAFDAQRAGATDAFAGADAALAAAQSARMSRLDATQWLSELHHVTDFATSRRDLSRGVTESLVELHAIALDELIPELHVPTGGKFAMVMAQKVSARLELLRRSLRTEEAVDAATPILVPGGPEHGGLSR
ncbi:zeta toxin family protein [Microbacterium sp. LWO13-1.2]|uniref:zeta toxin family protein n=1 Tax=Microbacterium sp. LWO13-1.2 TaxID=3135262 RepID=UPI0031387EC1